MEVKPKLILAVFLAPLAKDIYSIYVYIPIINWVFMVFKAIEIRVATIVVFDPTGRFEHIRIESIVILFPSLAAVFL
jgi:hypothetical protein